MQPMYSTWSTSSSVLPVWLEEAAVHSIHQYRPSRAHRCPQLYLGRPLCRPLDA